MSQVGQAITQVADTSGTRIIRHVCLPISPRSCQVARARGLILRKFQRGLQAQRVACEHKVAQPHCLSRRSALSALDGMNERLVVHRNLFRSSGSTQALLHVHEGYLCRAFIGFTSFVATMAIAACKGWATSAPSAELRPAQPFVFKNWNMNVVPAQGVHTVTPSALTASEQRPVGFRNLSD